MSRTLNVDRMRRYRERTSGHFVACVRCKAIFAAMDQTDGYSTARLVLGAEHFGHVMRDHWPSSTSSSADTLADMPTPPE